MVPSISILIITYNRPTEVLSLLKSLKQQSGLNKHVREILILNNASTVSYEPVRAFIRQETDMPVEFITHPENVGVAGGRNILIQKAAAPYLLVLDDDTEFAKYDSIESIAGLFDREEFIENNTAVITFNIHYYASGDRQKSAFPHKKLKALENKDWFFTYYFTGAAHLMRKELFFATGLYPEDFFYGMEEYDLSYRILEAGYTIAYDHSVLILHKETPLGRLPDDEKLAMMWLNKSKVSWRYLPLPYFLSTVFMWSLQYLKKTGFDYFGFYKTWKKIKQITRMEKRDVLSGKVLHYLDSVEARLWY